MSELRINQGKVAAVLNGPGGVSEKALYQWALKVELAAKRFCPVDTGRLRASIQTTLGREGGGPVAYVSANTEYAGYVEYGTYKMAAQPYLRPALAAVKGP